MTTDNKSSGAARTAIFYITVGALIDVWTSIYWIYITRHADAYPDSAYYWVYGFFFTGLVLLVIGMALGRIGRAARHADLPPEAVSPPTVLSPPTIPMNSQQRPSNVQYQPAPIPEQVVQPAGVVIKPTPVVQAVPASQSNKTGL